MEFGIVRYNLLVHRTTGRGENHARRRAAKKLKKRGHPAVYLDDDILRAVTDNKDYSIVEECVKKISHMKVSAFTFLRNGQNPAVRLWNPLT